MRNRLFSCTVGCRILAGCLLLIFNDGCSKRPAADSNGDSGSPLESAAAKQSVVATDHPIQTEKRISAEEKEFLRRMDEAEEEFRKHASERTPESIKWLLERFAAEERYLPDKLPDLKALHDLERHPRAGDHWVFHLACQSRLIRVLVFTDNKEARNAVDSFLDRFERRYGHTEAGKSILGQLRHQALGAAADFKDMKADGRDPFTQHYRHQ